MENKQTAVDWLISKCNDSLNREPIDPTQQEIGYSKALSHIIILLEEAKAMERQQIEDAFKDGENNIDSDGCYIDRDLAEQYYNLWKIN